MEGAVYALVMALVANNVVGRLFARVGAPAEGIASEGRFVGFIMSLGAGFYEELTFRVLLFGVGAKVLVWLFGKQRVVLSGTSAAASGISFRSLLVMLAWALASALVFSGVHYVGPLGDDFRLTSFTFRAVLGLILTLISVTRDGSGTPHDTIAEAAAAKRVRVSTLRVVDLLDERSLSARCRASSLGHRP